MKHQKEFFHSCLLSKKKRLETTARSQILSFKAPQTRKANTTEAKQEICKLLSSFPPKIIADNLDFVSGICGEGTFGSVKLARFTSITNDLLAVKTISTLKSTNLEIIAEAKVLHSLSGHPLFPYCFGFSKPNMLIMQFVGLYVNDKPMINTIHSEMGKKKFEAYKWFWICCQVIEAIQYMHSIMILHNDIKSNNIVISPSQNIKIIDFGKSTLLTNPVIYNLSCKAKASYNKKHRYLAYELRNVANCKQTEMTDTYSVGYLIKYIGYHENIDFLFEIGRKMKIIDIGKRMKLNQARCSINDALNNMKI